MDVIVIDVPNALGMLLFKNWATCLGGNILMDLYYATFPTCEGTYVTLHREPAMRCTYFLCITIMSHDS